MARRNTRDLAAAVHGAGARPNASTGPDGEEDRKGVLIRVPASMSKALRRVALDEDTTLQAIGIEAFEKLLEDRNRPGS